MPRNDLTFYDRSAAEWWQPDAKIFTLSQLNPPRFQFFDRYVPNWAGLQVLDVGCGGGYTCEFLAKRGAKVAGVDSSQACIEAAKAHAIAQTLVIDYRWGNAEALPFESAQFDVVTCVDVLEHVASAERAIAEIHRVSKPGGLFLFDTINRTCKAQVIFIWLLEDILQEIPRGIHDWKQFIPPEDLTEWMVRSGFETIEIKGFNILGSNPLEHLMAYLHYRKTGQFQLKLTSDLSLMYIGKATRTK